MDWPNVIPLIGVGLGSVAAGWFGGRKAWPAKPVAADPVLTGIGLELGSREQTERLIAVQTRIAEALEILADKRTDEMVDMHKALLERLDAQERREEQEEQRPRRPPAKRR